MFVNRDVYVLVWCAVDPAYFHLITSVIVFEFGLKTFHM